MNISITGNLGSGKSSVCRELKKIGYEIISAGDIFREVAAQEGVSVIELNEMVKSNPFLDRMIDQRIEKYGEEKEDAVFDSRLAWFFVPYSFKVFLSLDVNIAAERVFNGKDRNAESYTTIEEAREGLKNRAELEKERYKDFYDVDYYDMDNYDLIIDTATKTPEEIAAVIDEAYKKEKVRRNKVRLYHWYIDETGHAHGSITGHPDFWDGEVVSTSSVQSIEIDEAEGEVVLETKHNRYYCLLQYCNFNKQDLCSRNIPNYEKFKKQCKEAKNVLPIEPGNILVCFSNFDEFMFNSLYYAEKEGEKLVKYQAEPHVGTNIDSFMIYTKDFKIDLRFYWNLGISHFYRAKTQGLPLWFENVGDRTIYIGTKRGERGIYLRPGQRKQMLLDDN